MDMRLQDRTTLLLVSVILAAVSVESACPTWCEARGKCILDTCYCNKGFAGIDCSKVDAAAPVGIGQIEAAHIEPDSWRYYYLNAPHVDTGIQFQLSPTTLVPRGSKSPEEDLVLYVRRSSPPTEDAHDVVCGTSPKFQSGCHSGMAPAPYVTNGTWSEASLEGATWELNKVVHVNAAGGFSWWLGVQNRASKLAATFKLATSYTTTPCPGECSGRGECVRGRCFCEGGWIGEDCALKEPSRYTALSFGERKAGYVKENGWRYFFMNTKRGSSSLVVELELPRASEYGSLTPPVWFYLNRSDPPSETNSHKAIEVKPSSSESTRAVLTVDSPGAHSWWVGIQGSKLGGASFTVKAVNVHPCPSECSRMGLCHHASGQCFCQPGATLANCSGTESVNSPRLRFGVPVHTQVPPSGWRYHLLQGVPSGMRGELQVELVHHCLPGDLEHHRSDSGLGLYLGTGERPTHEDYTIRDSQSPGTHSSLSAVVKGGAQEWWVGVNSGPSTCTGYSLTASLVQSCLGTCSDQGRCVRGKCVCDPGFRGIDCADLEMELEEMPGQDPGTQLQWNLPTSASFVPPFWTLFYIDLELTSAIAWLQLQVHSLEAAPGEGGCASLEVYMRPSDMPTSKLFSMRTLTPDDSATGACTYTLQQDRPWEARWWLAVRRHQKAQQHDVKQRKVHIAVTAKMSLMCVASCSFHGQCLNGTCLCDLGFHGIDCSESEYSVQQQLPPVWNETPDVDSQWTWITSGNSYDPGMSVISNMKTQTDADYMFIVAIIACSLCVFGWATACVKMMHSFVNGVGTGTMKNRTSSFQLLSPQAIQNGFNKSSRNFSTPTIASLAKTFAGGRSYSNNLEVLVVPDIRNSIEIQNSRGVSPNSLPSSDALSPLPLPVTSGKPRHVRHRRVYSWGTTSESELMGRVFSMGNMLDETRSQ